MSKFIVYERTGEGLPRAGDYVLFGSGEIGYTKVNLSTAAYPILRRLPDAEVEALEARLRPVFRDPTWACAECGWVSDEKQTIVGRDGEPAQCPECASTEVVDSVKAALLSAVAGRDEEKNRAEKAEAAFLAYYAMNEWLELVRAAEDAAS